MKPIEFEVKGSVPPRNVRTDSMWNNDTEVPRVIELQRSALGVFKGRRPFSKNITLTIDIHIPKDHNKPGDLDNFIKGICDGLSPPREIQVDPLFPLHKKFKLPENKDLRPNRPDGFRVFEDDGEIVEINATKTVGEKEELHYRVSVTGE